MKEPITVKHTRIPSRIANSDDTLSAWKVMVGRGGKEIETVRAKHQAVDIAMDTAVSQDRPGVVVTTTSGDFQMFKENETYFENYA